MKKTYRSLSVFAVILMLVVSLGILSFAQDKVYKGTAELTISEPGRLYSGSDSASVYSKAVFDGCFGNQLSGCSKEFYNAVVKNFATNGKTTEFTYLFKNPITFNATVSGGYIVQNEEFLDALDELNVVTQSAMDAFAADHPEVYWLYSAEFTCSYAAHADSYGKYTGYLESITIYPKAVYSGAASYKTEYNALADTYASEAYDSLSRYNTVKNIHDIICDEAWYYLAESKAVHSSAPFFLGDGGMVCEGYAKTFKVLCDRLSIPCVLVRGYAGGPHMWNYVQMEDGKWYLVDVTWDDQDYETEYTYFLANSETKGFSGKKISEERTVYTDFSDSGVFAFTYPVLSSTDYIKHVHFWNSSYTVDVKATCTKEGSKSIHCKTCDATKSTKTIPITDHSYEPVVTPATLTKNGKIVYKCDCGDTDGTQTIARVTSFTLSTENYVYNGKNRTPKVTVKDADGVQLVKNVDYKTWVASSRSNIGKYYVKVTLMGNYSGTKNVYFYIRPGVPTTLKATQSTSYIKLTWDNAVGAAGYSVYRYDGATESYKKLKSTTALSYTDKELDAGTKYTYKVIPYGRSRLNNVYYSKSNIIIETATKTKTPSITVAASGSTKAVVKWNNVSGESGYQVWYSTSENGTYTRFGNAKANTTSLTVTGLTAGKTYYFKVRTYITTKSGYVYSSYSTVKNVKLAGSSMSVPSITVTDIGASEVLVKWKDISGESGYQVWYSTSKSGTYKKYSNVKANATSLTVKNLTEGRTYYFKVRAYKTADSGYTYSDYSSVKSVKLAITPDYSEVLQEYRFAIRGYEYYEYEFIEEHRASHPEILYYAYYDINGDGVNELLVAEEGYEGGYSMNDIFTYNNKPIPLFANCSCVPVWLVIYEDGIITENAESLVYFGSDVYNFSSESLKPEFFETFYYEYDWEDDYNFYYRVNSEGEEYNVTEAEFNKIYNYYNGLKKISPLWRSVIEPKSLSSIVSKAKSKGVNMAIASLDGVYGRYAYDYDYHMRLWEDEGYVAEFPFIESISESRFFVEGDFSGETFLFVPVNCKEVKIYAYKGTSSGEKGYLVKTMTDGKPFIVKGGYEFQGPFIIEVRTNDGKKLTFEPHYSGMDGSLQAGAPFYDFSS